MEWPGNSPDLNSIEHGWPILKKGLNDKHPYLRTIDKIKTAWEAFERAIVQEWEDIPQDAIDDVISSMDTRANEVIASNG